MNKELKYRPEIDGLRTIAVIGVIIYHLTPESLKGGFLGVDVFFVISGYLITSIIYRPISERRFSFWNFWKRRFKRLYPALSIVVLLTLIVGFWVLPNPERGALPMQALGALFSFSNILLWRTTGGYWDTSSENISLLHTWSLSLEEQYYICFPIFLFLVSVFLKRRLGISIVFLLITSLILSILFSYDKPTPAFYLLPTRMWELLIGSLLAIYSPYLLRTLRSSIQGTLIHLLGIVLIIGSYFLIENARGFPGLYPLAPCIGAYLILAFQCQNSLITKCLTLPTVVYIGKISYSLYLWHWPTIVYAYYISPDPNVALILIATFALAAVSYHYIEQPIRKASRMPRLPAFATATAIAISMLILVVFPKSPLLKGLKNFDSEEALTRGWEFEATDPILTKGPRMGLKTNRKKIVVLGSSHARALCYPIEQYALDNNYEFISLATSGVGITSKNSADSPYAEEINRRREGIVNDIRPELLVIAGMWSEELSEEDRTSVLRERLKQSIAASDKVIILGQVPLIELPDRYQNSLRKLLVAQHLSGQTGSINGCHLVKIANSKVRGVVQEIMSDRLFYIDPTEQFTDEGGNLSLVNDEAGFLYSDHHHVNDKGARLIFDAYIWPLLTNWE